MTIEELQEENAKLKRQIAKDREKGQDLTVKTIFKLSDEIKALKAQLKEYEQKVKDGRLVELPCEVGDKVYFISKKYGLQWAVITDMKIWITNKIENVKVRTDDYRWHTINNYTIFLTRAEAEKKLAEVKGEEQEQERLHNDNSAER